MRKALEPKRVTVPAPVNALQPVNRGTPGEVAPEGELERLRAELREALDRQAAVGEVLRIINSSAFDLQAVFRRVCERSARSCDAFSVALWLRVGDKFSYADSWSEDEESYEAFSEHQRSHPFGLDAPGVIGRAYRAGKPVMIENVHADPEYPKEQLRYGQVGTLLGVPLIKDGVMVGGLSLNRRVVRLFSEHEILLVQTFADQAVIAIENARLVNETKETLEQQTATGNVLDAISRSAFDITPVMQTIANSAQSLCQADEAGVMLRDGEVFVLTATAGDWAARGGIGGRQHPDDAPDAPWVRAIRSKRSTHITDTRADPLMSGYVAAHGHDRDFNNTRLVVPITRDSDVIGVIRLGHKRQAPFTDRQIKLVETFAAQAAIAIENTRLFEETKEALERQTATSEVLKAISDSTSDLNPMFEQMLAKAVQLCGAAYGQLYEEYRLAASINLPPELREQRLADNLRNAVMRPADRASLAGRVRLEQATVQIPDVTTDRDLGPMPIYEALGIRSVLGVPMRHGSEVRGVITLWKKAPGPFPPAGIRLVETFADQAMIAIEKLRLFNETKEALDRQTAISEILRAIAGSPSDERPVLQTIATSAARYTGATDVVVFLARDDVMWAAGYHGDIPAGPLPWPEVPLVATAVTGRAILEQRTIAVADIAGPDGEQFPDTRDRAANAGFRAILAVPLMREGKALGALYLRKPEAAAFTTGQIQLVETFANQAVIAIENVRLFNATKAALEQQTATADVLRLISRSAFDLSSVLDALIETAARLANAEVGTVYVLEDGAYRSIAFYGPIGPEFRALQGERRSSASTGSSVAARTGRALGPVQIIDVLADPDASPTVLELARAGGYRTILGVPLLRDGVAIGALSLRRTTVRAFSDAEIALVSSYADQAVIAMENVRLFNEIQEQSRQLEAVNEQLAIASKHKSDFLANMSHELRTPLNAIIGFSDVLEQRMFGELNDQQTEYVRDISGSGRHLLTLVNEILDLAKVEAGRMELELTGFVLEETIRGAIGFVRERASQHRIELATDVTPDIGTLVADERKVRQVLLNLLSNAVKFTPDGGTVRVSCRRDGGEVELSVRDTGIGIATDDLAKVFEEFQQVGGPSARAHEGTGLGLTLAKRFIELHGGRIWVDSEVGKGTTFTFRIPAVVVTG